MNINLGCNNFFSEGKYCSKSNHHVLFDISANNLSELSPMLFGKTKIQVNFAGKSGKYDVFFNSSFTPLESNQNLSLFFSNMISDIHMKASLEFSKNLSNSTIKKFIDSSDWIINLLNIEVTTDDFLIKNNDVISANISFFKKLPKKILWKLEPFEMMFHHINLPDLIFQHLESCGNFTQWTTKGFFKNLSINTKDIYKIVNIFEEKISFLKKT
ncbi:MAG: hypothetical protein IR526_01955 [Bordetella sp.]|nr:MAG: hypothetical protein IR526_01955 [Bordetella sp.]